jgi:hypothetical protein
MPSCALRHFAHEAGEQPEPADDQAKEKCLEDERGTVVDDAIAQAAGPARHQALSHIGIEDVRRDLTGRRDQLLLVLRRLQPEAVHQGQVRREPVRVGRKTRPQDQQLGLDSGVAGRGGLARLGVGDLGVQQLDAGRSQPGAAGELCAHELPGLRRLDPELVTHLD